MPWFTRVRISFYFNPRPREGDDKALAQSLPEADAFQSTSPRGGRPLVAHQRLHGQPFQSTSPRGGRLSRRPAAARPCHFNPRPREGDDSRPPQWARPSADFNPRPREGDDQPQAVPVPSVNQFQSTSPRGGRPGAWAGLSSPGYFNPRPREGDDGRGQPHGAQRRYFNPRPREGDDLASAITFSCLVIFQSTSPRGGRPRPRPAGQTASIFQSTSPRGGRLPLMVTAVLVVSFQSTSPRGGRRLTPTSRPTGCGFQSTSPRGGRRTSCAAGRPTLKFQSTSPRGGRLRWHDGLRNDMDFNPRPREGDDDATMRRIARGIQFQSTSPRGGRPATAASLLSVT